MKKLVVLVVLSCLLAVLGATAAPWSLPAAPVQVSKVAALATDAPGSINEGKIYLQAHNILAARNQFALAVAADPANQEANLLYGVTRVFAIMENQSPGSAGLDSVREIFELSGFSFTAFGIYGMEGTGPEGIAATTPRTGAMLDFVTAKVLPELDAALLNLAKVTSPSFSSSIAPAALATYGDNITVDYADALVLKALLNVVKCNLNLLVVYGPDVKLPELASDPDQLLTYKQLFADPGFLTPREPTRLATARSALIDFIDGYTLALPLLTGRSGSGHHLFVVDAIVTNEPAQFSTEGLTEMADTLAEIKTALSGTHVFPGTAPLQDRTVDLSKFFNAASPLSIRSGLSDCASGTALPDATLKGLFPLGLSGRDELASRYGAHILSVACTGRDVPLLQVDADYMYFGDYGGTVAGPRPVTINNRGTGTLQISSIGFGGSNAADFTVEKGTCASLAPTLGAGASCDLSINMKRPPATYGSIYAELQIASDDLLDPVKYLWVQGYQQTPTGGTISGKVKDAVTGQGMSAYVYFEDPLQGYAVRMAYTDATGAYSVSDLPVGNYKVRVSTWDASYVTQWYNNKPDKSSANTVVLTTAPLPLADVLLAKGSSVSGLVKDAQTGAGLSGISITLFDSQSNRPVASGSTSYNGSYAISGVPGGSYKVQFSSNYGGQYLTQWYSGGAAVTVTAPQPLHLEDTGLAKGATITGRVTDAATLAPLVGLDVQVFEAQSEEFVTSGRTDSSGGYSAGGLPTGSYKVFFQGNSQYSGAWYQNAASLSQATLVTVSAPNTRSGIDAALAHGGSISGRVTDRSGNPLQYVRVSAFDSSKNDDEIQANTDYSGNYSITGLAPGEYQVEFHGRSQDYVPQYYSDAFYPDESSSVPVVASGNTGGIDAELSRGGSISGKVSDSGGAPLSGAWLMVYDANGNEVYDTETDASGQYLAKGLPAGGYKIRFEGDRHGLVNSFNGGAARLAEAPLLQLSATLQLTGINATLLPGGSISGTVTDAAGAPVPFAGIHIFDLRGATIANAEADAAGRYQAGGIPAGSFKLLAEHDPFAARWYGGKTSFATATAVTVGALADVTGANVQLGTGAMILAPVMIADFGPVVIQSTTAFKILQIYNTGSENMVPGQAVLSGANASEFRLSNDLCSGRALPRGGECSVRVWFTPQSQLTKNATVTIPYNAAGTTSLTIPVLGSGVAPLLPATSTTVASSANPSLKGAPVTFTATVTPVASGSAIPTGGVTFKDGAAILGTATLNASGKASFPSSLLSAGTHSITAQYGGSSSYNASSSAALVQTVQEPQRTLSVALTGDGSGSVHSNPSGIACSTGSSVGCSANFTGGGTVALIPSAASYSSFGTWSGACTGTGSCQVVMDAVKNVGASFIANPATVRIDGKSEKYYSLDGAFDAIGAQGQTVRARAQIFVEHVIMTTPMSILFKGGFTDLAFGTQAAGSFTVLDGSLRIRQGALKVDRLRLR